MIPFGLSALGMMVVAYIVVVFRYHELEPTPEPWRIGLSNWMDSERVRRYIESDDLVTMDMVSKYPPEITEAHYRRKLIFHNMEAKETRVSYSLEGLVK